MSQTYLVTGANRGIGLEFVRQLVARGDAVIATAREPAMAADLGAIKGVRLIPLDVNDSGSIAALGKTLAAEKVDVLINNAGVKSTSKRIAEMDAAEMQAVFLTNAIAPFLVLKSLLPALRAGKRRTVVQITSELASIAGNSGGSTYAYRGSKAALNQMNRSLANELRPEGFTCIAMHPGWVQTDMGGPEAPLTPQESVRRMLATMDKLTTADTGSYIDNNGHVLPW